MFKVTQNPEFTHDVPVMVPIDDGHEEQNLRTRFRVMSLDEMEAFDLSGKEGTTEFLRRAVVRFTNLADEDGNQLECTEALRDQQIDLNYVRLALTTAYTKAMYKARVGN